MHRLMYERFQQHRGAPIVDIRVTLDLLHALTDPDRGGEVVHVRNTCKRLTDGIAIAYIAHVPLHLGMQVTRESRFGAMHLLVQCIEDSYSITGFEQRVRQMRADEPAAPSDEHATIEMRL